MLLWEVVSTFHSDKLLKGNASRQCPGEARKGIEKVMRSPANNTVVKTDKGKRIYARVLFICLGFVFGLDYGLVLFFWNSVLDKDEN